MITGYEKARLAAPGDCVGLLAMVMAPHIGRKVKRGERWFSLGRRISSLPTGKDRALHCDGVVW